MLARLESLWKKLPTAARWTLVVVALLGLLNLAGRLDPGYAERERASAKERAARDAEKARVAALLPEAKAPAKGVRSIDFGDLAFDAPGGANFASTSTGFGQWAPEKIKALDGREVVLSGFMLPTKTEAGKARECLILANQMACCYGNTPKFCEFVVARVLGDPVPVLQDQPLAFTGRLKVGDVFEGKAWTAYYTLEVTDVGRR